MTEKNDLWIFAYGSLMWNPGFEFVDCVPATLNGFSRDLCILSHIFRGTPETPGLVMGLNPGGSCCGKAFLCPPDNHEAVFAYLNEREMPTNVYTPCWQPLTLQDGRRIKAYTFVAIPGHPQYVGNLAPAEAAQYVLQGHGQGGSALEYLENTLCHLRQMDISDPRLEEIHRETLKLRKKQGK